MTEIERCVCGGEPFLDEDEDSVFCPKCQRYGPGFYNGTVEEARARAIAAWNQDMRGFRLLEEVADAWSQCYYPSPYLVNKVFAWARERDQ